MAKYVMALDAGTTSNRCILFNEQGEICSMAQKEFRQFFPNPGWVEHDANEIWSTMLGVAVEAMNMIRATAADIAAIGITNQRETAIVWNKETGEPVYNAIVWQCRRTSDIADALKAKGLEETYRQKTGLIIDAYFSATKIKWILDNVEGARELAEQGKLLFGTVETWLIWKFTKGAVHVTDYSNASRTMLFNINDPVLGQGDPGGAGDSGVHAADTASVQRSLRLHRSFVFRRCDPDCGSCRRPAGGAFRTDLFPRRARRRIPTVPDASCLMNTGEKPVFSKNGLVTTIAWGLDGKVNYALEGSIFVAGAAIQWLRDEHEDD